MNEEAAATRSNEKKKKISTMMAFCWEVDEEFWLM